MHTMNVFFIPVDWFSIKGAFPSFFIHTKVGNSPVMTVVKKKTYGSQKKQVVYTQASLFDRMQMARQGIVTEHLR